MKRAFKISCASKTDLGLKRKVNEDSLYVDEELGLFVVLDGIGGHQAGEVASQLGLASIRENVTRRLENSQDQVFFAYNDDLSREANILMDSLTTANKVIFEAAHSNKQYRGMGTTVATLLVGNSSVAIAHVGDSRIYLIRNNSIDCLTEDHSLVMEQLKRGIINEEEARRSEMKNIITQALGADTVVRPAIDELVPLKGDIFLLCSDGLTDMVTDKEILDMVWEHRDSLDLACDATIEKAKERGGKDNITTILVGFKNGSGPLTHWFDVCKHKATHNVFTRLYWKIIDLTSK